MRWKKTFIFLTMFSLLLCIAAFAYNGGTLVYVTYSGECYHRDNCSYLKSRIEITLEDAVNQGYRACSRCHPPVLGEDRATDSDDYVRPESQSGTSTRSSSSSSGSMSSGSKSSSTSKVATNVSAVQKEANTLLYIVGGFFAFTSLAAGVISIRDRLMFKKDKEKYQNLYGGKSLEELVEIPPGCCMGADGLPREVNAQSNWGNSFTFWVSSSGYAYHKNYGCSGARKPINALSLNHSNSVSRRSPCSRCKPKLPDVRWAEEASRINMIKKRYGIE